MPLGRVQATQLLDLGALEQRYLGRPPARIPFRRSRARSGAAHVRPENAEAGPRAGFAASRLKNEAQAFGACAEHHPFAFTALPGNSWQPA
ncbi:transcriptional regulator2C Cro/CI family [Mizugakiibacter sediminis]|uniref:Transcriptional regulator2C Cro/CI family n=1 Tax=Mizugakiibacter sediminis TaxID=1475481 RepID=A0A0K8QSY0_9GAMM|nr:transcriptional regulator2C Cro/CI family [Mizugakiibacter sediminis]